MASHGKHRRMLAAVGMLVLLLVLLAPALVSLQFSVKEYSPRTHVWGGPWVGLAHFARFFQAEEHSRVIGQSLLYGGGSFVIALLLGSAVGFFVPRIRTHRARGVALALLLLPVFVPPVGWVAGMAHKIFGGGMLTELYVLAAQSILGASVIGFAGAAYEMVSPGRGFLRGVGWAAFLYACLLLTPDFELIAVSMSPENTNALEVMDTYTSSAAAADPSAPGTIAYGAAVYALKAGMQLLTGAAVSVGAYVLFMRGRKAPLDSVSRGIREISFGAWLVPVLPLIGIGLFCFAPLIALQGGVHFASLLRQLFYTLQVGLVAFLLAYLMIRGLRGLGYIPFMVFSGLLLALSNPEIGHTLISLWLERVVRSGIGTSYIAIVRSLLSPTGLLLVILSAKVSGAQSMKNRPVWLLALFPACYAMARHWGAMHFAYMSEVFMSEPFAPPGVALYFFLLETNVVQLPSYIWTLLPSLLLGVLGCIALSIYLDRSRVALSALAPEDHQPAQHIVEDDHEPLIEEVGDVLAEAERADGDAHEEQREKQGDDA